MKDKFIEMYKEMIEIISSGYYYVDNKQIKLKFSSNEFEKALYFSEGAVYAIIERLDEYGGKENKGKCKITVENIDTLEAAKRMYKERKKPPLVLNFANPVRPGGGVRVGAKEQEEELCRRSTLLASIENKSVAAYYENHKGLKSIVASDAVIVSPHVEVFKDVDYHLLENTYLVSVLTCAAPMVSPYSHCLEDKNLNYMENLLYRRIAGMLLVAIHCGYSKLVLGAWGCGAHNNDPALVAEVFKKVLEDINADMFFEEVCFAILCKENKNNLEVFEKCFISAD